MRLRVWRAALKRRPDDDTPLEWKEMPRYFFDFDDGKTDYVDTIGNELADPKSVAAEAAAFVASVFRDAAHDARDRVLQVSVRNDAGRVVFTTTLSLQSQWEEAGHPAGPPGPGVQSFSSSKMNSCRA
jgi:hypothetical protein